MGVSTIKKAGIPPPLGGINMLSPAVGAPLSDAIYCYNMTAREMGLGPRLGSREYATGIGESVRTVLGFRGSQPGLSRLFVATRSGIWDVTGGGAAPAQVVVFPTQSDQSGYGICTAFVDLNNGHNLLYTDEENGYYVFREATSTWVKVTRNDVAPGIGQVGGVDPAHLAFVMVWKNRVFLVERFTGKAWYTDINAMFGTLTAFNFGTKFREGGELVGLWNWTGDAGDGSDDKLVGISRGGDVVVYQGTNIASADTFDMKGVWSVGDVPAGRRIASAFGGDVMVLSVLGAVPLSKLSIGNVVFDRSQYATQKIPTLLNSLMGQYKIYQGWAVMLSPEDGTLIVLVPNEVNVSVNQLVMSLATRGWSMYRGLNMTAAASWDGKLYYGTDDGRVLINTGTVDGVTIADPDSYSPIEFSLLTTFQAYGSPGQKIVQFIRTTFMNQGGKLQYESKPLYGYNLTEPAPPDVVPTSAASGTWDTAVWDSAVWAGDNAPTRKIGGGFGMAPEIAIALRGRAISRVTLVGWHLFYTEGGLL